jgi:hypothetical protein
MRFSAAAAPTGLCDLDDALRSFTFNGAPTRVEVRDGVPYYFNEFWTARQRQAHSLHEVSYRACFKPQLPGFFIDRFTEPGDVVYDPFMGRGTTPLQAVLMGRRAIGADINPLSIMLARPRTLPPALAAIAARLEEAPLEAGGIDDEALLTFYHPETLRELYALRAWLIARADAGKLDPIDDWIRMVAINRLSGHSSGFLSVYSLPPNQAVAIAAQRKINAKRNQTPPRRDTRALILRKSKALLRDPGPVSPQAELFTGPAAHTPEIQTGSVKLVVTSPPFLDVVDYAGDNWLRCWFAGVDPADVAISMHRKEQDWLAFIRATFVELARIVCSGGHVAFEVGEVRRGSVALETLVLEAIAPLPFQALGVLVNVQEFTKTANCWGVANNAKGTNSNRIVIARRL